MKCPKCERKLKKVFHDASDEMAIESLNGEIKRVQLLLRELRRVLSIIILKHPCQDLSF